MERYIIDTYNLQIIQSKSIWFTHRMIFFFKSIKVSQSYKCKTNSKETKAFKKPKAKKKAKKKIIWATALSLHWTLTFKRKSKNKPKKGKARSRRCIHWYFISNAENTFWMFFLCFCLYYTSRLNIQPNTTDTLIATITSVCIYWPITFGLHDCFFLFRFVFPMHFSFPQCRDYRITDVYTFTFTWCRHHQEYSTQTWPDCVRLKEKRVSTRSKVMQLAP